MSVLLPPDLQRAWDGTHPEDRIGETVVLVTVDEEALPHLALLSAGEVAATASDTIYLALWTTSRTTENLDRGSLAILAVVHGGALYKIALRSCRLDDLVFPWGVRACVRATVDNVTEDRVGYADLTASMTFALEDPAGTLERWNETLAELRAAACA